MFDHYKDNKRSSTLENALQLLDLFSLDEPEFGITEIAARLGIANSTAHRLVTTLMTERFISKDSHTNLYRLGVSVLALARNVHIPYNIDQLSQSILENLVMQCNETAHIGILHRFAVIYLNKIDGTHPVHLSTHLGKRNPTHCTSLGQVLLAYQPAKKIEDFLSQGLKRYTAKTIVEPVTFRTLLGIIKKQGYAISIEELFEGVSTISVPIHHPNGQVIAAVSIAGPTQRIISHKTKNMIKLLAEASAEITGCL